MRLAVAAALVAAGGGVAGALLGTPLGVLAAIAVLAAATRRATRAAPASAPRARLPRLAAASAVGVAALTLMAVVQHVDVIVAQHRLDAAAASAMPPQRSPPRWSSGSPSASRSRCCPSCRAMPAAAPRTRGRLARTLALVAAIATPYTLICAVAGEPLLRVVFGARARRRGRRAAVARRSRWRCSRAPPSPCSTRSRSASARVVGARRRGAVAEPLLLRSIGDAADDLAVASSAVQLALAARRRRAGALRAAPPAGGTARVTRDGRRAPTGVGACARSGGCSATSATTRRRSTPGWRTSWPPRSSAATARWRAGRSSTSAAARATTRRRSGRAAPTSSPSTTAPDELGDAPPEGACSPTPATLPFDDGSIDGVVCSNLLEHTPDAEAVIREIERVLARAAGATCRGRTGTRRRAGTT